MLNFVASNVYRKKIMPDTKQDPDPDPKSEENHLGFPTLLAGIQFQPVYGAYDHSVSRIQFCQCSSLFTPLWEKFLPPPPSPQG